MQILIETEDPADASSLLKLSYNNIPIAEGLTAAEAHMIAGAILDRSIPVGRPGPESLAARLVRMEPGAECVSHGDAGSGVQSDRPKAAGRMPRSRWVRSSLLVNADVARHAAKLLRSRAFGTGWPWRVNINRQPG